MLAKEFSPRDEIQVLYDRDVINKVLGAQKYAEHIERCEKEQNTIDDVFWHKDVGGYLVWDNEGKTLERGERGSRRGPERGGKSVVSPFSWKPGS
jgi:hypothetical protein